MGHVLQNETRGRLEKASVYRFTRLFWLVGADSLGDSLLNELVRAHVDRLIERGIFRELNLSTHGRGRQLETCCHGLLNGSVGRVVYLLLGLCRGLSLNTGVIQADAAALALLHRSIGGGVHAEMEDIEPGAQTGRVGSVGGVVARIPVWVGVSRGEAGGVALYKAPKSRAVPPVTHEVEAAAFIHDSVFANVGKGIRDSDGAGEFLAKGQIDVVVHHGSRGAGHLHRVAGGVEVVVRRRAAGWHGAGEIETIGIVSDGLARSVQLGLDVSVARWIDEVLRDRAVVRGAHSLVETVVLIGPGVSRAGHAGQPV